jgi:hypothetical protein
MRFQYMVSLIGAAAIGAAWACGTEQVSSPVTSDEEFTAALAGTNVVPPVTTAATGSVAIALVADTFLVFRVAVSGLDSATSARIHAGAAGVADTAVTPVATVFQAVPCRNAANLPINTTSPACRSGYTGQLSEGQFKPALLTGIPVSWGATPQARFDSLLTRMRNGTAYVQVYTKLNPTGAIRGQIQSAP